MAPSIFIDNESDFNSISSPPAKAAVPSTNSRVLLLAPPSIASHEEKLRSVLASHDRSSTDLQMLDRVSAGLVTLPDARYDLVTILTDADGTRKESSQLLSRLVFAKIVPAIKAGGKLQAQDGTLGQNAESEESREAILAGLVLEADFLRKPNQSDAVPLRLLRRNPKAVVSPSGPPTAAPLSSNGKRKSVDMSQNKPNGVGFVDFSDDLDLMITGEEDDELIDEDTLLTEEDLSRPVDIPPECAPRAGKRRRACKDCTCGLAQKLAAEDKVAREDADAQLRTLKLGADDLAEVDFTIQGKVGSCGNCSLGDAFRCDGCPYIGMPAFQPGEEVRLLNNELQL